MCTMIGYRIPEREMCCMLSIGEAFVFYLSLCKLTPEVLPHLVCQISRHLHTQFSHLSFLQGLEPKACGLRFLACLFIDCLFSSVLSKQAPGDAAEVVIFRMLFQMVLVLRCAGDILDKWLYFYLDAVGIWSFCYKLPGLFQYIFICAVHPGAVFFSVVHSLVIDTVRVDDFKQMSRQLSSGNLFLIICHLDTFHISVIGRRQRICLPIGAPCFRGNNPRNCIHKLLYTPEATSRQINRLHSSSLIGLNNTFISVFCYSLPVMANRG